MGDTSNEGSFFLWYYYNDTIDCKNLELKSEKIKGDCFVDKEQFEKIVANVSRVFGYNEDRKQKILNHYGVTDSNATAAAQRFLSSLLYDCGLQQFADKLIEDSDNHESYVYTFDHRSVEKRTSWPDSFGTVHAALIEFLFGRPFRYPDHYEASDLENEQNMSKTVMELYGQFANTGKPNKEEWKPYSKESKYSMRLDSDYNSDYPDDGDIHNIEECSIIMPHFKMEGNYTNTDDVVPKKYIKNKELNFENDRIVDEYLGIPFAEAPLKDKRFLKPEKLKKPPTAQKPFNASKLAKTCPQKLFNTHIHALDFWNPPDNIDENCLQLNMWVPKNKSGAVLVNLCGGAYWRLGASNDIFNGSVLAAYSRAIVVNLNFRLGALGFARFKSGKEGVTGNMGLLDQQMGLKWIQENIKDFGGDPSKVTLMGEQTGASSAEAHLYSEKSKGLFNRIALTSGVLENTWASKTNSFTEGKTDELIKILKCTDTKPSKRLKCLQQKSYNKILDATVEVKKNYFSFGYPFSLTHNDGSFFKDDISKKSTKIINHVDVLMGNTKHEGSFFLYYYFQKYGCNVNWNVNPPTDVCFISESNFTNIVNDIQKLFKTNEEWKKNVTNYYKTGNPNKKEAAFKLLSDLLFDCGLLQFADKHSEESKDKVRYVYRFYHASIEKNTVFPTSFGTMHAALVEFLFGRPFRYPHHYHNYTLRREQEMSKLVMEMYGNFAANGTGKKDWESYTKENQKILVLNSRYSHPYDHIYLRMINFKACEWLINPFASEQLIKTSSVKPSTTKKPSKITPKKVPSAKKPKSKKSPFKSKKN
uniref:Acetylcholinesterase n=1 Tax=Parastrongyloides trichosuri TaxID=131310 RepID=A0A0N4Z696_PARTI